jgi:hypothetical protein
LAVKRPVREEPFDEENVSIEAWLTLGVVTLVFFALAKNLAPPDLLLVAATAFLAATGIISSKEAFGGFANSGVLAVATLFVVAAGLREKGILDYIGHRVLGRTTTPNRALGINFVEIPSCRRREKRRGLRGRRGPGNGRDFRPSTIWGSRHRGD